MGESGEYHWHAASHWQTLLHNVVSSTPPLSGIIGPGSVQQTSSFNKNLMKLSLKSNNSSLKYKEYRVLVRTAFFFICSLLR